MNSWVSSLRSVAVESLRKVVRLGESQVLDDVSDFLNSDSILISGLSWSASSYWSVIKVGEEKTFCSYCSGMVKLAR